MHRYRADALRRQFVVLVLHQGDERAHDDRESGQNKGWKLIDERFAASRRHHYQCVLPGENSFKRLPLTRTKIVMPKAVVKQLSG